MGHGTRVGNINRTIAGGLTLVGGVQRKIAKGLTLVNGVRREIVFASPCVVKIECDAYYKYVKPFCYVTINGTNYTSDQTLEVEAGTVVVCNVCQNPNFINANGRVYLNGILVVDASSTSIVAYNHTVEGNVNIAMSGINDLPTIKITT